MPYKISQQLCIERFRFLQRMPYLVLLNNQAVNPEFYLIIPDKLKNSGPDVFVVLRTVKGFNGNAILN